MSQQQTNIRDGAILGDPRSTERQGEHADRSEVTTNLQTGETRHFGPDKLQLTAAPQRKNSDDDQAMHREDYEEGVDEDRSVVVESSSFGGRTTDEVLGKICRLAKPFADDEDLDIDSPETMLPIERLLCEQILDMLRADYGPFWSVIVMKRLALAVGLRSNDRFANFKIGFFNVLIFECNQIQSNTTQASTAVVQTAAK